MRSRRSEVKKGVEDSDRVDFTTNGAAGRDPELINWGASADDRRMRRGVSVWRVNILLQ
jgi:hypothetical protein